MKSIDKVLNWRIGFVLGALLLIYGCVSPNVAPLRREGNVKLTTRHMP